MTSNDSGPPAQRRRKLVLRKIPTPGPLPVVRPPQKSIPFVSVIVSPEAEAAAAITSSPPPDVRPLEAPIPLPQPPIGAARAVPQPPAPYGRQEPRIAHAFLPRAHEVPVRYAAPQAPASETGPRATVAPVIAPARPRSPDAGSDGSPWARFARASTRASTLLAIGGALAAVALFATLGVAVGERSGRPAPSPASLQAVSPGMVETRSSVPAVGATQRSAPAADRAPAELAANPAMLRAETTTIEAPPVARAGAPTTATTAASRAPAGAMSGWAIAPSAPETAPQAISDPSAQAARGASDPPESPATSAATAPEIPPSPAPTVDPLVQAVREDIREDEARSK